MECKVEKIQIRHVVLFYFLLMVMVGPLFAQPRWFTDFRQIKLGETRRSEIEKMYENPIIVSETTNLSVKTLTYKTDFGRLLVGYSNGRCSEGPRYEYNAEVNTVIAAWIFLAEPKAFSKLKIDLREYERRVIPDLPGLFTYANGDMSEYFNGTSRKLSDYSRVLPKGSKYLC